jgi:tetratricopeptide (TPR) repeat protein
MPLKSFFTAQAELLRLFMMDPNQTVRCIRVEPDMKPLLMKMLAGLDADESSPHLMACSEVPFETEAQYFEALLAELSEDVARWERPLAAQGYEFRLWPEDLGFFPPQEKFVTYAGAMADSFPDHVGSFVLILAPDAIADPAAFRKAIEYLAANTPSPWMKYLVIDERQKPVLDKIEEQAPAIVHQTFHISPDEIEAEAKADLAKGYGLTPHEVRQYTALVAGCAFARREYDEALRLQQQWVEFAAKEGAPAEVANACYNLGNTHMARKDYPAAEETYGRALDLALDHHIGPLLPMVLTNLGVTLYRQGRLEQAVQSFQIAREHCQAQNLKPTEAHVLDCMGKTYEAGGQPDEAARCWNEALAVYDAMSSETFAAAREGGKAPILEQLERLGKSVKPMANVA